MPLHGEQMQGHSGGSSVSMDHKRYSPFNMREISRSAGCWSTEVYTIVILGSMDFLLSRKVRFCLS
ncbi:hypothetical protein EMPG_10488 [Blastomyces silverae]|uniref:Uncharacterized protein n=1 Tax=Blastomyces silverae TaxID=2060906 RepID=A0A0H1B4T1_9EURO|nr:hypothetical protein EMPG_10488 [Blastomyces silverae]